MRPHSGTADITNFPAKRWALLGRMATWFRTGHEARGARRTHGGSSIRSPSWGTPRGQGSARLGDVGFKKSTNIQLGHEVGVTLQRWVGGGVDDPSLHVGGVCSFRAVPGAKIHHFKKSKHRRDLSCDFSVQTSLVQLTHSYVGF